jgi:hypothetical protein
MGGLASASPAVEAAPNVARGDFADRCAASRANAILPFGSLNFFGGELAAGGGVAPQASIKKKCATLAVLMVLPPCRR